MTTKKFLDRYDSKQGFTEDELEDLWWGDLLDIHTPVVRDEEYGEPDRWNTLVDKVIRIENRYFMWSGIVWPLWNLKTLERPIIWEKLPSMLCTMLPSK